MWHKNEFCWNKKCISLQFLHFLLHFWLVLNMFLTYLHIFANFACFCTLFVLILSANYSDIKFCLWYLNETKNFFNRGLTSTFFCLFGRKVDLCKLWSVSNFILMSNGKNCIYIFCMCDKPQPTHYKFHKAMMVEYKIVSNRHMSVWTQGWQYIYISPHPAQLGCEGSNKPGCDNLTKISLPVHCLL